jgi:DNA-binding winged helix-turn-helix (wHTH) protein
LPEKIRPDSCADFSATDAGILGSLVTNQMTNFDSEGDQPLSVGSDSYVFGRFRLTTEEHSQTLFADGHVISLSTAESTILRVLLERRGEFVRTEDLLKTISPSPMASENLVHGAVRGLRRTLNDAELIRNERSKGYSFTGHVDRQSDQVTNSVLPQARSPHLAEISTSSTDHQTKTRVTPPDPFVIVALLVTAPVVLLPFGLLLFGGNWESLPRQLGFIQALMILVAIAYDVYFSDAVNLEHANAETTRALIAVHQLRGFWRLLLLCWCCLYVTLPFSQWLAPASAQASSWQWQALQIVTTLLNNSSALMLVLCYVVLNRPTVITVADREVEDISLVPGLTIITAIALLEVILIVICGRFGIPNYSSDVLFAFDLLSGIIGGIAMALCISRLDSRLLGTKGSLPVIPVVLYLYVVIQPFYPLVNRTFPDRPGLHQHFDLWIIQLAFMLKAVMYIYVTELFKTRRFLFYMIHARRIYENVESEWSDFKQT